MAELTPIQYYTALDPYYYIVDNRPLRDIETNIVNLITEFNDSSGEAKRSSLGAAAAGFATLGYFGTRQSQYVGDVYYSGLETILEFGFSIEALNRFGTPPVYRPRMSVHNKAVSILAQPGSSPSNARVLAIWATPRESNDSDGEFSGSTSDIWEIDMGSQVSGNYAYDPSNPFNGATIPNPPAGSIPLLNIAVPGSTTNLNNLPASNIRFVQMKTIDQLSNPLSNAQLSYVEEEGTIAASSDRINISNNQIDYQDNPGAIELFIDGTNQFDFVLDSDTGEITLPMAVTAQATWRVRQIKISLG